jgi:hypothetical protein
LCADSLALEQQLLVERTNWFCSKSDWAVRSWVHRDIVEILIEGFEDGDPSVMPVIELKRVA